MDKFKIMSMYIAYPLKTSISSANTNVDMYSKMQVEAIIDDVAGIYNKVNNSSEEQEIKRLEGIVITQSNTITELQNRLKALQHVNNELLGLGNIKRY